MELSQQQVDKEFAALMHGVLSDEPAPVCLPRAWRWRHLLVVPAIIAAVVTAIHAVRVGEPGMRQWAQVAFDPEVPVYDWWEPVAPFVVPGVVALVAFAVAIVVLVNVLGYWSAARGGLFTSLPVSDPRASEVAWAMATRRQRKLIGEHQFALQSSSDPDTAYERRCDQLRQRATNAVAAGKSRRMRRAEQQLAILIAGVNHTLTVGELQRYVRPWFDALYPSPVGSGGPRPGRVLFIIGAILVALTLGAVLPVIALLWAGSKVAGR